MPILKSTYGFKLLIEPTACFVTNKAEIEIEKKKEKRTNRYWDEHPRDKEKRNKASDRWKKREEEPATCFVGLEVPVTK